jgi:predicted glycosyltransferase
MGGYNSICELLSAGKPAIVVPRIKPRREQLIRTQALSRRGLLRMLHPDEITAARLLHEIERLLEQPGRNGAQMPLDGLPATATAIDELLASEPPTAVERTAASAVKA